MTDFATLVSTCLKTVRKYEEDFMKLDSAENKLLFIYEKLNSSDVGVEATVKKWKKVPGTQTDDTKAREHREKGNEFYKNKQLEKAAQSYRKALNYLPGNTWRNKEEREELVVALGNLSAVSYETNNFFESRIFTELVLACGENNINEERRKKFSKRIKQCSKALKSSKQMHEDDIILPKYKKESFTIVHDDLVGRYAVAVEDIKFGEVILIEDPVGSRCKIDKDISQCENCNQCLQQKQQIIASPFDKDVLFCSLNCLVTAVETYHFYESKLNFSKAFPKDDLGSNLHLLPLRLILQKPPSFFSSSPSLGRDYGCGLLLQEIAAYPCLDSMVTHMEDQGALAQMEMGVTAVILLHCLTAMEYLEQQQQLEGLALKITTLLYHYQAKMQCTSD